MFDWIGTIGIWTWSVFFLFIFLFAGAWLLSKGGFWILLGLVVFIGSLAFMTEVIAYKNARDPFLDLPIGYATTLVAAIGVGLSLIANRNNEGPAPGGRSMRDRVPTFNSLAVATVVVGLVLIFGAGSVIVNRLDLPSNNAGRGLDIASEGSSQGSAQFLRIIERFLAK